MSKIYLGVDIGGTKTCVSLGDDSGHILIRERFLTDDTPVEVMKKIKNTGVSLLERTKTKDIVAIGISCGGPLDVKKGLIQSPPHLPNWKNIPISSFLSDFFSVPAYLQNDANACALAEWQWGNGKQSKNMVFLTFGTGFGAGLILDGRLYEGTNGQAGEIGHVRSLQKGPLCYGKHGSIESFCSGEGLSLQYQQRYGEKKSGKDICCAAAAGDANALRVVRNSARHLGSALAILIDVLNPEVIVIGSIFTRSEGLYRPEMERMIRKEALPENLSVCRVLPSALGEDIGDLAALGVARNALMRTGK